MSVCLFVFFPGVALSGAFWRRQTATAQRKQFVNALRSTWTAFENHTRSPRRLYKAAECMVLPGRSWPQGVTQIYSCMWRPASAPDNTLIWTVEIFSFFKSWILVKQLMTIGVIQPDFRKLFKVLWFWWPSSFCLEGHQRHPMVQKLSGEGFFSAVQTLWCHKGSCICLDMTSAKIWEEEHRLAFCFYFSQTRGFWAEKILIYYCFLKLGSLSTD